MTTVTAMTHEDGRPLQEWMNANEPPENMYHARAASHQMMFVRDTLSWVLGRSDVEVPNPPTVVGTHRSKSVVLPVYSIMIIGVGEIRLRGNFHNWVASVKLDKPVAVDFLKLFRQFERVQECYAEGFDPSWIFGPYELDHKQFTCELANDYDLYTFCYLLYSALRIRRD